MRHPPLSVVTGSAIIFLEKPTFNIISATSSLVLPQAWMRLCEVTGECRRLSRGRGDGVGARARCRDAIDATRTIRGRGRRAGR